MASSAKSVTVSFSAQTLTHFGGVVLLQQFFQRLGLRRSLTRSIRFTQRNHRYSVSESLLALIYPNLLGLGRIETTRLLKHNGVFQHLTGLPVYPDPQTLRRFLSRFGEAGLGAFRQLHDRMRRRMISLPHSPTRMIFDLDSTILTVYGRQERAKVGFNPKKHGRPSYMPLLCVEAQTGDCWEAEYHPGDTNVCSVTIPLWEATCAKVPPQVKTLRIRADAAFFDHEIIEAFEAHQAAYVIVARLSRRLQQRIAAARYHPVSASTSVAEFSYQPLGWRWPRRFVAVRRVVPDEPSWQLSLFRIGNYTYRAFVTNLDLTPLNLWRFYNDRAEAELVIREMKEAYALGKIPTGEWEANRAYFHLVVFSYNLLNWFRRFALPPTWQHLTLQTIRHRLLLVPAELVRPQRRPILKLPRNFPYQDEFLSTLDRIKRRKLT